jgi:hypothetical protein
MKTLRSLFALCALAVLALASARADYLELEQDSYHTTSTESRQILDSSYHVFGYTSGGGASLVLDYYFPTIDIDSVEFEAWYEDDEANSYSYDLAYGGAIEAGEDFSWLDLGLDVPPETPGTITVVVTFFFGDDTYLTEWLSARIE